MLPIDRRQWWTIRLYYFLFIGATGFVAPFLGLYYRRLGLTGTQIGLLAMLAAGVSLLIGPLWANWADRLSRPQRLLQISILAHAATIVALSQQRLFVWIAVVIVLEALAGASREAMSDALALRATGGRSGGFGSIRV